MSDPGYQDIPSAQIPEVQRQGITVRVLAGDFEGIQGPVKTQAIQPQFLDIHLQTGAEVSWPVDAQQNGFIYVYEGSVLVGDQELVKGELGVLEFDGTMAISSNSGAKTIVVSGTPINEPIVQYGPFVMNTEAEIQQALRDYQSGVLA
jgi:hypothetical protein